MIVRDEALWSQQRAELLGDQTGRDFLEFIETWTARADELYAEDIGSPATAIRYSLEYADQAHGRISAHYLGQMLVVIATHWKYGEEMAEGLGPIEMRLVQDMLAMKCAELQQQAEEDPVIVDG